MGPSETLVGREAEQRKLSDLLLAIPRHGQAVILLGDPGIGKTALQTFAVAEARQHGYQVLCANGSQGEAHLPFAGLHQLVHHKLDRANELPATQRDALLTAFGRTDSTGVNPFLISLAALELFGALAADEPLVICIDDAHWVDTPTMDVISFVARRISAEPILLLLSARPMGERMSLDPSISQLEVEPLDQTSAATLLLSAAPQLGSAASHRILSAASGNPLGLLELPKVTAHHQPLEDSSILPLTARLERAFADRVRTLPTETRSILTVASVDDGRDVAEILAASTTLCGKQIYFSNLEPAISSRLISSDGATLEFHHPLVRSAVCQMATISERRSAHDALAEVLAEDPDRAVWHRAVLLTAPDEKLAAQLDAAAHRSRRRGAVASAVEWFERAAALSSEPADCYSRLLSAAEVAFELGRFELVQQLRSRISYQELRPEDKSRLLWLDGVFNDGRPLNAEAINKILDRAHDFAVSGDTSLALHLYVAASRFTWWADPGVELRSAIVAAVEAVDVPETNVQRSLALATACPEECGNRVLNNISTWEPSDDTAPVIKGQMGTVAFCIGDFHNAIDFLTAPIDLFRVRGQLSLLAQTLALRAWAGLYVGAFDIALGNVEATRLCEETGQPVWAAIACVGGAGLSGLRTGDMAAASLLDAENVALGGAIPISSLLAGIQFVRGITFLSAGDFPAAYSALSRLFDEHDRVYHRMLSVWAVGYFAEAATFTDHGDQCREVLERLRPVYEKTPSIGVTVAMDYARATVAENDSADELFRSALSHNRYLPWHRARLQLAYGSWLRRNRRPLDSRDALRSARDTFDSLGMPAWARRADRELLAAGERQRRLDHADWTSLTAHEMQIAELAAQGKTNREIAQQLYMSHRTVGAHLYHIFPKLGINSRSQLGRLLASAQYSTEAEGA
jgi:DNA-binding CsgD family transcriptional regulator